MFRHAERLNSGSSNPPLSARGLSQAMAIALDVRTQLLTTPTKLLASPKIRAQQTFQPLALQMNLDLQIHSDLDERQSDESLVQFERRVQAFLNSLQVHSGVLFFVTHLDWIETALQRIPVDSHPSNSQLRSLSLSSWAPAQSIEFEILDSNSGSQWRFLKLRSSST